MEGKRFLRVFLKDKKFSKHKIKYSDIYFIQLKLSLFKKDTMKKIKGRMTEWEENFATRPANKRLISTLYKDRQRGNK